MPHLTQVRGVAVYPLKKPPKKLGWCSGSAVLITSTSVSQRGEGYCRTKASICLAVILQNALYVLCSWTLCWMVLWCPSSPWEVSFFLHLATPSRGFVGFWPFLYTQNYFSTNFCYRNPAHFSRNPVTSGATGEPSYGGSTKEAEHPWRMFLSSDRLRGPAASPSLIQVPGTSPLKLLMFGPVWRHLMKYRPNSPCTQDGTVPFYLVPY